MLFSKKPTIIYLQKNGFLLYSKNHPDGIEFKFPGSSDGNKFSDALQTFIAENALTPEALIIVLSAEIITQKTIDGESPEEQQKEVDAFIKESDIPQDHQAKETFELDNKRYILIADKKYYQKLATELQSLEWDVISVVPISLFRDLSDSKMKKNGINQKELQEIYSNSKLIKDASMLSKEEISTTPGGEKEIASTPSRSVSLHKSFIIAGIAILALGILGFLYAHGTFNTLLAPTVKNEEQVTPTTAPIATPTTAPTEEDKTKLTVQILNGTGTTGQAGKVKTRLEKLDYSEIKTANGETKENTTTMVTFSDKVSKDYREEIVKDLEELFETVESKEAKEGEFDIVILTGTEIE